MILRSQRAARTQASGRSGSELQNASETKRTLPSRYTNRAKLGSVTKNLLPPEARESELNVPPRGSIEKWVRKREAPIALSGSIKKCLKRESPIVISEIEEIIVESDTDDAISYASESACTTTDDAINGDQDKNDDVDLWGRPRLQPRPPDAPPPRSLLPPWRKGMRGTLKLLTFGVEHITKNFDWYDDTGQPHVEDGRLRQLLQKVHNQRVDFFLDARNFPDPQAYNTRRHIGVHPTIIQRIVKHEYFADYLACAKFKFDKAAEKNAAKSVSGKPSLVVAVYCKSGKHRSVAVSECLKYIAVQVEGWMHTETCHLSKARWEGSTCRGECKECKDPCEERDQAFRLAADIWCES